MRHSFIVRDLAGTALRSATERHGDFLHRWVWVVFDGAIWFAAIYAATWLRFDFKDTPLFMGTALEFAVAAVLGHLLVGAAIGP